MPGFVNCLAFRLAQDLAISITESDTKMEKMMELYRDSLNSAEAQNECMDYERDEDGSDSWYGQDDISGIGNTLHFVSLGEGRM